MANKLEAAIQPRELAEGLWRMEIELELVELGITVKDTVWISVIPSPLEIDIEGQCLKSPGPIRQNFGVFN